MKTKVILKGKHDAIHEYNIKEKTKKNGDIEYKLSYSKNADIWHTHILGKTILICIDNGNNHKFIFDVNYKKMGYDESFHMYLILHYIEKKQKLNKIKFK